MLPLEHAAHPFARFCGELRLMLVIINTSPRFAGAVERLIAAGVQMWSLHTSISISTRG
jgi:hypothetical protein